MSTPEQNVPTTTAAKTQRVLACVLCQQRKIKCDRVFPCAHCVKAHVQCVPANLIPRQRRRRYLERELLERLDRYESLLRQNNIHFAPLHKDYVSGGSRNLVRATSGDQYDSANREQQPLQAEPSSSRLESVFEAKTLWDAMNQSTHDPDDDDSDGESSQDEVLGNVVQKAYDQIRGSNDHLLFGSRNPAIVLSTLHPEVVNIFRLWQIYSDNVNSLLKVTHIPTLQGRIIDAASNLATLDPTLEALMFSIYCVAVQSLVDEDCQSMFSFAKDDLLTRYRFGCHQALLDCGYLRSSDLDCLTALYLYIVSLRPGTDPRTQCSLLAVAIRIAQRIGIHSESANAKCGALEAEMRRRLWWSIVLYDARVCEMADHRSGTLAPTWDCKTPLNVNDFELRPEMKDLPSVQGSSSDSLFAVVRSELADSVRHSAFHLAFINPALISVAKNVQDGTVPVGGELVALEKMIEEKYLRPCNPDNALHYMTMWTARVYLARNRLVEHYWRFSKPSVQQSDRQRDAAVSYAHRMLESDTKLQTSSLTKGYLWLVHLYFPFPAYIHILQDTKRRPAADHVERSWEVMSHNYAARSQFVGKQDNDVAKMFHKMVLMAWEACEAIYCRSGRPFEVPQFVLDVRDMTDHIAPPVVGGIGMDQPSGSIDMSMDDFAMPVPFDFGTQYMPYDTGAESYGGVEQNTFADMPEGGALNVDASHLNWAAMDWGTMQNRGG